MTQSEKRNFKVYSHVQQGEKAYLQLFSIIESFSTESYEKIEKKFKKISHDKSITITSNYLYDLLLEFLVSERHKKQIRYVIYNGVEKAKILFELKLFEEAFAELGKAEQYADSYEDDIMQMMISKTKMNFHSNLDFRLLSEQELVSMQMKLQDQVKYSRTINQYNFLLDILNYRLLHKKDMNKNKKRELEDLVMSELNLLANNPYSSFQVQKLHLLFQSTYYIETNEYSMAVRNYKYLIDLFNQNSHLLLNPPAYYLKAVEGILDSLLSAGIYDEMEHFIDLLDKLCEQKYPSDFLLKVSWLSYYYRMYVVLHTGDFEKADNIQSNFKDLASKISSLPLDFQLKYYLLNTLLLLSQNKVKAAHKVIKSIFMEGKIYKRLPLFRLVRLVNILIYAELGDINFVEAETTALKRNVNFSKLTQTEKLVYKFLRLYPLPHYGKSRMKQWEYFQKKLDNMKSDKVEKGILKTFNFPAYIESKLTNITMQEVLERKA